MLLQIVLLTISIYIPIIPTSIRFTDAMKITTVGIVIIHTELII